MVNTHTIYIRKTFGMKQKKKLILVPCFCQHLCVCTTEQATKGKHVSGVWTLHCDQK